MSGINGNKIESQESNGLLPVEQKAVNFIKTNSDAVDNVAKDNESLNVVKGLLEEEAHSETSPGVENDMEKNNESTNKVKELFEAKKNPEYDPYHLTIEKKQTGIKETGNPIKIFPKEYIYTTPLLTIRNMVSGDSSIPSEYSGKIIEAVNNLGKFEKLKIIGCTDASKIITPNAIKYNKEQFDKIKRNYENTGGICQTYEELLKSTEDPQNTILGYTRAMEGILSLRLSLEQMKKIEIGNKLGTKENDPTERGFDVETDYSETTYNEVKTKVYTNIYTMLGNLNKENIGRTYDNQSGKYLYSVDKLNFATTGFFEKIYKDVAIGLKEIIGKNPDLEEKIKKQTTDYLDHLINVCGGKYMNGTWSSENMPEKTYFFIKAVDPENGFLTQEEFTNLTENGDISLLGNKKLSNGQTLSKYIEDLKITSVYKPSGGMYFYNTELPTKDRKEREIPVQKDYIMLGLYLGMKNSTQ